MSKIHTTPYTKWSPKIQHLVHGIYPITKLTVANPNVHSSSLGSLKETTRNKTKLIFLMYDTSQYVSCTTIIILEKWRKSKGNTIRLLQWDTNPDYKKY